jgi:Domain of unknown function (DUF1963)
MDPKVAALLEQRREPAIYLDIVAERVSNSRLGGLPALPAGVDWPLQLKTGKPLSFLAQVDLSALPKTPLSGSPDGVTLPLEGMLFFFADIPLVWPDWKKKSEGVPISSRVVYAPTAGPDRPAPEDLPMFNHSDGTVRNLQATNEYVLPVKHLRAHLVDTFWWGGRPDGFSVFENDEDREAMMQSIAKATGKPEAGDGVDTLMQMLGAAPMIQNEQEAARKQGRIFLFQRELFRYGELVPQFWIMPQDLRTGRFERAWATFD